jgi:hypothetical protein
MAMSERQQAWRKSRWLRIGLAALILLLGLRVPVTHA